MIALRKLEREVARPFKQLAYHVLLPARRVAGTVRRIRYDAARKKHVRVSEGKQKAGCEIAILLIYQPDGVFESTLFTLSYLLSQGISPVIVSNLPLTDNDRDRLAENSWLVIERPNVGYDFGGYREGVLTILERGVRPKALYVLNDSIWVPLNADSDIISKCRAASEDVFGLQIDHWRNRGKLMFVHSYFYRFSENILSSPCFREYWEKLRLLKNKQDIITGCEVQLTHNFLLRGFTAGGIGDRKKLKDLITGITDGEKLNKIVAYQYEMSNKERKYLRPIIKGQLPAHEIREQLGRLIEQNLIFRQLLLLHPWIYQSLRLDYVKKTRYPVMNAQRAEIRRLGLHRDYHPAVRDEIEQWDTA